MPVQPGVDGVVHAVLVGVQADRGGLDPQRHVLGDQADVAALGAQVQRDDHDPAVVAVVAEAGRQHRRVAVVELDVQRAAVVTDRHRRVQPAVRDPQVVEHAQGLPGEPAELGVVALALQFADDDEREHHVGVAEAQQRAGVGEQDGGVEDERTASVTIRLPWGARRAPARRWPGPGAEAGCRPPWSTNSSAPTGPPVDGEGSSSSTADARPAK